MRLRRPRRVNDLKGRPPMLGDEVREQAQLRMSATCVVYGRAAQAPRAGFGFLIQSKDVNLIAVSHELFDMP